MDGSNMISFLCCFLLGPGLFSGAKMLVSGRVMFLIGGGIPISALELLDVSSERVYFPLSADYHGFGECNLGGAQPPLPVTVAFFMGFIRDPHLNIFHNPGEKLATWARGTRISSGANWTDQSWEVHGLGARVAKRWMKPTAAAIFVVIVPPRFGCNLSTLEKSRIFFFGGWNMHKCLLRTCWKAMGQGGKLRSLGPLTSMEKNDYWGPLTSF